MKISEIVARRPRLSVLIVGDICLDRWCFYDPAEAEPSRETGLPRIGVTTTEVTPGAGGTIANNLAAMGVGRIAVLGAIGEDGFGHELRRALATRGISSDYLISAPGIQTFTYTKLLNLDSGDEDRPRVDFINNRPLEAAVERQLLDHLQNAADTHDIVLVSDQAETSRGGVVTPALRELLAELAPAYPDKLFIADSRARIDQFRRLILKPNRQEAQAASEKLFGRLDYAALLRHCETKLLAVTHGGNGVLLVSEHGERWVPTRKVEKPVDICGAGDSFCAGFAVALKATGSPVQAAEFGNLVASVTIMKKGTGTASLQELLDAHARG